jgi:Holliday junction resolvase-like predicted endonuclease
MNQEDLITETIKEKGEALEKNIEFLFQSAGFETKRNVRLAKYEIDVLAKIGDRTIVIECKNYQNASMTIRNLIHQWNSKNTIIKANKIVLVIAGEAIKQSDKTLASQFDMEIWDENDLNDLFNLTLKPAELKERLLKKISFKPVGIAEQYRDEISELVIVPILSNVQKYEDEIYELFNDWLRIFIRTEMQINGTTKKERLNHIELFEDTKERRGFLNFKFKRKEKDYWNLVMKKLKKGKVLDANTQKRYYNYMNDLFNEYKSQVEFYEKNDQEKVIRRLVYDRIYNALGSESSTCKFGFVNSQAIEVIPLKEGKFFIRVGFVNEKQANLINWILTSEYNNTLYDYEINGNGIKFIKTEKQTWIYTWICQSLEETSEKVYRILEEYIGYDKGDELRDFEL